MQKSNYIPPEVIIDEICDGDIILNSGEDTANILNFDGPDPNSRGNITQW